MTSSEPVESFAFGIALLREFAQRERHSRVHHNYEVAYFRLGRWVEDIRAHRQDLDPPRRAALDAIPQWDWDATTRRTRTDRADFAKGLADLAEFVERNGHARVPQFVDGKLTPLGSWVKLRRREYKENTLSPREIDLLNNVRGWVWNVQEADFLDHADALERYANVHKHASPPLTFKDESGFGLGRWANTQRRLYAKHSLASDRVVRLSAIPYWRF